MLHLLRTKKGGGGKKWFWWSEMAPLSQGRGWVVFWATFPDGWHMLICFPAAISLSFHSKVICSRHPSCIFAANSRASAAKHSASLCGTHGFIPFGKQHPAPENEAAWMRIKRKKISPDETKRSALIVHTALLNLGVFGHSGRSVRCVEKRIGNRMRSKSKITLPF